MKKVFKNTIIILIVLLMIAGIMMPLFTFSPINASSTLEDLQNEINNNNKRIDDMKASQSSIELDISKEMLKLEDYRNQIKTLESQIEELQKGIDASEAEITRLQGQIDIREKKIGETEEKVKQYMVNSQSSSRVNGYFEFVMGGSDFSEMVRRLEGMSAIKRFNEDMIREINKEKEGIEADKVLQETERTAIQYRQEIAVQNKEVAKEMETHVQAVVDELHKKEAELEAQMSSINDKNTGLADQIKEMSGGISGSNGFSSPMYPGDYSITANVWAYDNGSPHMGIDLGAWTGSAVMAVGNGLVVSTNTGCSPGNWACGLSYGNYISYLVNVEGHNYGILYGHLSSVNVSKNQTVSAGQVIGYSGNTGASTGPHLHIEVIDMGGGTIFDAWDRWNGDPQFGTGSASSGGKRCQDGYGAPCRLNPGQTLGI